MRVLVTRPEPEAQVTAARLTALGHQAVVEPLTRIVAVADVDLARDGIQAVAITSLNAAAVCAGRSDLAAVLDLPVFAVGDRSAEAARAAGFRDVRSAVGDRAALVRLIATTLDPKAGAVLWLAGEDRSGDLSADLAPYGPAVVTVVVYRAEPIAGLSAATRAAIAAGEIDAALVFSPRSGAILLEKLSDCGFSAASLGFAIHAISETAARPLREAGVARIIVAPSPDSDAMMATLGAPAPPPSQDGGHETRRSQMPSKSGKGSRNDLPPPSPSENAGEAGLPPTEASVSVPAAQLDAEQAAVDAGSAVPSELETPVEPIAEVPPIDGDALGEALDASANRATHDTESPADGDAPIVGDPAATPPAPIAAAPKASGPAIGVALAAAVIGGALGVGGTYVLAMQGVLPNGADGRIVALERSIAAVKPAPDTKDEEKIAALEKRLADLAAARPTVDLSALESRIAKLEATPAVALPGDLTDRLAGLEAAAKARLEAAKTSVAGALAALPSGEDSKAALGDLVGKVDQAIAAVHERSSSELAGLKGDLDKRAADLQGHLAALEAEARTLGDKVAALTSATTGDLARRGEDLAKALDGMRQRVAAVEGWRAELDGLTGRLGGLETALKDSSAGSATSLDAAGKAAAEAQGKANALEGRVAAVEAGAQAARKAQSDAVLAVALADLKSAVDAGRPFKSELDVVKAAAPKGALDLAVLDGFVAKGVPSVVQLRERWPAALRAMTDADAKRTGGTGVFDRLLAHATSVVRVRPAGETAGVDLAALASRVEARLGAGDLPGALVAWKALPDDARTASAAWGAALEARVTVDKALAAQTAAVIAKLAPQSQ